MTVRQDDSIEQCLLFIDECRTKEEIRKLLLSIFIDEECKTKLRYYVEVLSDGTRIYIERPGRLNKGCDFIIYVENLLKFKNNNDKPPKFDDVLFQIASIKKELTKKEYRLFRKSIDDIYNLKSFKDSFSNIENIPILSKYWSYELILKLLRWFFIEQDITYWSNSGRNMLYEKIKSI